jgi:hypothetical protein
MSRSNPNSGSERPTNPAVKFFEWSSTDKCLQYYDKTLDNPETKQKGMSVNVKIPFMFLVLDQLSTVGGYRKRTKTMIWANEVRDTTKDILYVKSKDAGARSIEDEDSNIYQELRVKDLKFIKSVYILFFDNDKTWKIGNIKMKGASLGSWFEFTSPDKKSGKVKPDLNKVAVVLESFLYDDSGEVKFNKPVFAVKEGVPEEINAIAIEKDKELQLYLAEYFAYIKGLETKGATETPAAETAMKPNTEFTTPVSNTRSSQTTEQAFESSQPTVVPSDFGNNGDDLPFSVG